MKSIPFERLYCSLRFRRTTIRVMYINMKKSVGAVIAASFLLIGQSAIYGKENGKPATLPTPSPKASSSSGQTPGQSQSKNTPAVPSPATSSTTTSTSPTASTLPTTSSPTTSSPTTSTSPGKSQPSNAAANPNSKTETSNGLSTSSTSDTSKKSSNSKLNPSVTNAARANAKAEAARNSKISTTADCKPSKDGKVPSGKDACYDFIVVFQPGTSRTASNKLVRDSGAQVLRTFSSVFNGALVNGPLAKMQALANNPNILVVEDDLEVTASAIQTSAPWGLDRIDQQPLPLSNSFDDGGQQGANSYSYVVDTGVDATNIDFEGRVAPGYTAIVDGRGSADCNGHGTHVAGIIGGTKYGVAKKTNLIPVRVLDCAGSGSYSSVISGLDWIAANYRSGDAAVVNMSLGGPASSTLDGAVRKINSKGVNVVVAAGNSSADACNYSPARVLDAITVGATANTDARASYSNYGTCLDVFAPGSSITSTWLGATGTNTISGTSMASPNVAGVVARFIGQYSGLTPAQVANSIKTSSTKNLVTSIGSGSPNQLAYLFVLPDTTTVAPVDSSPTFKKNTPRGRFK